MVFVRLSFFPGGTAEHYAALQHVVDSSTSPPDRLFFAAGAVPGGWQVVQAWRSHDELEQFNAAVLRPAYAALGGSPFPAAPVVTDFEAAETAPPPPH